MPSADAGCAQAPALRLASAVLLAHQPRPDAPARSILCDFLKEVRVGVKEEAQPRREGIWRQAAREQILHIRLAGAQREGHLLGGIGAGVAIMRRDRYRIEAR